MNFQHMTLDLSLDSKNLKLDQPDIRRSGQMTLYDFKAPQDGVSFTFCLEPLNHCFYGHMDLNIKTHPFRDSPQLSGGFAITLRPASDSMAEAMCALYQHRDWWTRPAMFHTMSQVPDRTEALLYKCGDIYGFIFALCGDRTKTYIHAGEENAPSFRTTAYTGGLNALREPVFLLCESGDPYTAITRVMTQAADLRGIPLKKHRPWPAMFDSLGWCSWDAFYTDIDADKVTQKARELAHKHIPVRWMLMDDGWHSRKDDQLTDFSPDPQKFPGGFLPMIEDIRSFLPVEHFGVWHALGGYWGGIHPDSDLALSCGEYLYRTNGGKYLPHWEPEKGFGFWHRWYSVLKAQGIDFVKVDGQSALKNYYKNDLDIGRAAGTHTGLEAAAQLHMNGQIINCMGMAVENLLKRPVSAISRSSDDFVPQTDDGFFEHLLQNAFTALYHDQLYYCDWDMFWTGSSDPFRHGLLRALSGGPIYFSDKIGDTCEENIRPLIYSDGRILRANRSALPTPDCLFTDPAASGFVKLSNMCHGCGIEAVFFHDPASDTAVTFSPGDIPELGQDPGTLLAYDYFEQTARIIDYGDTCTVRPAREGCALMYFIPMGQIMTPIGLIDKYMAPHSILESFQEAKAVHVKLYEGGIFAFHTTVSKFTLLVDGKPVTAQAFCDGNIYAVQLPATASPIRICFQYEP